MKLRVLPLLGAIAVISACSNSGSPISPLYRPATPTPSGMTPAPMPSGTTPTPTPSGMTPTPMPSGMTPTPMPSGMTPAPMPSGMTPTPAPVATATPAPTPAATAAPANTDPQVVEVTNAFASTESYYQTLPHTDPASDISAVAAQMVSSGQFSKAVVTPGGITGTLPDGTPAVVFADRLEDLGVAAPISGQTSPFARSRTAARLRPASLGSVGAGAPHEIAFLVDSQDRTTFDTKVDAAYATAFTNAGFVAPNYNVDAASISLDNLAALGNGHPIDYLNIETHGMVAINGPTDTFLLQSVTPVNDQTKMQYAADIAAGRVVYSYDLTTEGPTLIPPVEFSFTVPYLTSVVHFNPNAVVVFGACWSSNPLIIDANSQAFQAAGVGHYYGWTKATLAHDEYESIGFLLDRALGEQSPSVTNLNVYATQRVPAQRPFSLENIFAQMLTETRSGPIYPAQSTTYAVSNQPAVQGVNVGQPPVADGTLSQMVQTILLPNGTNLPDAPAIAAMPSISTMSIAETATSGTLTINGTFPPTQGTVSIAYASGTTPLTVVGWTPTAVTALLPASGNGSAGLVTVTSALGISSNAAPITQWNGTLTYLEQDDIPDLGSTTGSGTGSLAAQFNVTFRADVHPYVLSVDTAPQPQQFDFTFSEGNSTGYLTNYSGTYTSSSEKTAHTATFSNVDPGPAMHAATPPLMDNTFEVRSYADQPAPCNSGDKTAGVVSTMTDPDVFCPLVGFVADPGQVICSDDDGGALCEDDGLTGFVAYSGPFDALGLLTMTLDPKTYAISVAGTTSNFIGQQFYGSDRPATAMMAGTIGAPAYAPSMSTTASRARRALPSVVHRPSAPRVSPDEAAYAARYRANQAVRLKLKSSSHSPSSSTMRNR